LRLALALLFVAGSAAAAPPLEKDPEPSKAERARLEARLRKRVGKKPDKVVSLFNYWTKDVLPLDPEHPDVSPDTFNHFLHCHFTGQTTTMDIRLVGVLAGAAKHFAADRMEIVSGYRAPKFNLMLRKKGHEVARDSQHTYGHAVDFRIPGVATRTLVEYVRSLRLGGAGFYPESQFVHADTGPLRTWAGR
jgi:uncharacterized protein DUF882